MTKIVMKKGDEDLPDEAMLIKSFVNIKLDSFKSNRIYN